MQTIQLDPELIATFEQFQAITTDNLAEQLNTTMNNAMRSFIDGLSDHKLDREQQAFIDLHAQLVKTHLGQFVAIHQGQVVDFDQDERTLYVRVCRRYPHTIVGIFPVSETSEMPAYYFTSSRTEALS